jgi:hypothetical protein
MVLSLLVLVLFAICVHSQGDNTISVITVPPVFTFGLSVTFTYVQGGKTGHDMSAGLTLTHCHLTLPSLYPLSTIGYDFPFRHVVLCLDFRIQWRLHIKCHAIEIRKANSRPCFGMITSLTDLKNKSTHLTWRGSGLDQIWICGPRRANDSLTKKCLLPTSRTRICESIWLQLGFEEALLQNSGRRW